METIYVIGDGPAGITAAIYAKRGGAKVVVLSAGDGALARADKVDNYYGVGIGKNGKEILKDGRNQAKELGIEIIQQEVVSIEWEPTGFRILTDKEEYQGASVILAMGAARTTPNIKGLKNLEGKGISYCAICDGFFFKDKTVAILGGGEYAAHEAEDILKVTSKGYILTNGEKVTGELPVEFQVIEDKIISLKEENGKLDSVCFENGNTLNIDGLFIALGVASSLGLAKKLGLQQENNKIVTDDKMKTNIEGIFAAGDTTKGTMQIAKAVYEGSVAGIEAVNYLKNKRDK